MIVWPGTLDDWVLDVAVEDELLLPVGKLIGGTDEFAELLLLLLLGDGVISGL